MILDALQLQAVAAGLCASPIHDSWALFWCVLPWRHDGDCVADREWVA